MAAILCQKVKFGWTSTANEDQDPCPPAVRFVSKHAATPNQAEMPCQMCAGAGFLNQVAVGKKAFWHVRCRDCGCVSPKMGVFEHDGRIPRPELKAFEEAHEGRTPGGQKAMEAWAQMQTWIAHGKLVEDEAEMARAEKSTKGRL